MSTFCRYAVVSLALLTCASCGQPSLRAFTLHYQLEAGGEAVAPWPPSITIQSDGKVEYEFADCTVRSSLSVDRITQIRSALNAIKFFDLHDQYGAPGTDMSVESLSVTADGRTKVVRINVFEGFGIDRSVPTPPAVADLFRHVLTISQAQNYERRTLGDCRK